MTNAILTGHRGASVAVLVVGGGGLAAATWVGGDHGLAVGLIVFYAVAAVAAYIWSGRDGDVGAIMRAGGDERQRRLDRDATAIAGLAMTAAAIIGAILSAARNHGDLGGYGVICFVGGVTYAVALLVLKRRG
jgi:hypothetical protein